MVTATATDIPMLNHKDTRIEACISQSQKRACGTQLRKPNCCVGNYPTSYAPAYAEQQAFPKSLPDHLTMGSPECASNGSLGSCRGGTGQQQTRHIRAGNQHHRQHGAQQHPRRQTVILRLPLLDRLDPETYGRGLPEISRYGFEKGFIERSKRGACRFGCGFGRQPADCLHDPHPFRACLELLWQNELRLFESG